MKKVFHRFARCEDGNATIDWVVLMAGLVLLTLSVVVIISGNVEELSAATMDRVESMADFSPG